MSFKYILRLAIQPGFHESERLNTMVQYCEQAKIDDVMFFINCEELNRGHLTKEQTLPWLDLISRAKQILQPMGITTSINPWITTLHTDRGRELQSGQNFQTMVDPHGQQATAVACPMCANWQAYIQEMYALYASVEPYMLWVEDDFRLHNHAPLQWGGCFCPLHMQEYSKRAGKQLEREEFISKLLQPGKPHEYRRIWLDTSRDVMLELADKIGSAVHAVSPETRVGLMSSSPAVHCAEGRDWTGILSSLSGPDVPMVNRPHLPAYQGTSSQAYTMGFAEISQVTQASIPASVEIYPELENHPDTRFSKSNNFTRLQLETSTLIGSQGITMNIFDMMGNGAMMTEGYQRMLADTKPLLNSITDLGLKRESRLGVHVLFNPKSSYAVHTWQGCEMYELCPNETVWAKFLSAFSISNRYDSEMPASGSIIAISGQYLRGLDEQQIRQLFADNYILLEAEAAYILWEMGYGELAGIASAEWVAQDSGVAAYEQVCNGKIYAELAEARLSCQVASGDYLKVSYSKTPYLYTQVMNPYGEVVGAGCAVVDDHVFILPYGHFGMQCHLNTVRQQIIQDALVNATEYGRPTYAEDVPYVYVQQHCQDGKNYIMLSNFSDDDVSNIKLFMPDVAADAAICIGREGEHTVGLQRDDKHVTVMDTLPRWQTKVLVIG